MKKKRLKNSNMLLIASLLNILLLIAVLFLMNYVKQLLDSDVKVNLTQIVTQNKDVIASRLKVEVNNLEVVSDKISDSLQKRGFYSDKDIQEVLATYMEESNKDKLFVANKDGKALFLDGSEYDVAGRQYFKLGLQGTQNISDPLISRVNGDDIFVNSVPLYYNKEIIGTVQKSYTRDEMYELCSIPLFASQGYMYIINSEGYVLLHTSNGDMQQSSDNYYRDIYMEGNEKASNQLKSDIQIEKSGFIEMTVNKQKVFSAYSPLEAVHDWFLITSVPTSVVAENANVVVKLFYGVLLAVVLIFGTCLFYFYWYKNRQRRAIEKIAFVDPVTGGNTYNKFVLDVQESLEYYPAKEFSILKFDIDNFKYVNNYFGFDYGDHLLKKIADLFKERLKGYESVARIASDNFVALLENDDADRISEMIQSVQEDEEFTVYISSGVYKITDSTESVNLMVDKAGTAAQTVKGKLNHKIKYYNNRFDEDIARNEQLKRSIRHAIDNDCLVAYYQPKVNVYTGQVVGAEALVRWIKEDGTIVPPGMFIPMCEETGIIMDVDMVVFEKVLKFLKRFLDEGIPCMPISINFSRLHLSDSQFLEKITGMLRQYNVPTKLIEIELTESAIFEHVDIMYDFTEKLRNAGFGLAMDDFGSGYSSLNMLKNIPIDVLKIDKEFLSADADKERRDIIFHSIVQMVHRLNIRVVVEGVEDEENVELMKACECDVAQGYYYSKPIRESEFEKLFRAGVIGK